MFENSLSPISGQHDAPDKAFDHVLAISRRFRLVMPSLALALLCIAFAGPALAVTPYDGTWSVVVNTRDGACQPSVRYAVQIENGAVINQQANDVAVQGRVNRAGAVRVAVQSGDQWANGSGRLGRMQGGGVWRGQGSAGACQGTWVAQREGYGATAELLGPEIGAPRYYNYAPGYGPGRLYNYAPGAIAQSPETLGGYGAWCAARFRSYDPASGTYLGFDGMRHPCP